MSLLRSVFTTGVRRLSCIAAYITKPHRNNYLLTYPTKLVLSDGSSVTVRYPDPRQIIKLPLDLSTLSEQEAKDRIERRRPKTKVKIEHEDDNRFDAKRYINLMKNQKKKK